MKALSVFLAILLLIPALAAGNQTKAPQPEGQPDYMRQAEGWFYACWNYPNSRAIHGRLQKDGKEVFGKHNGEKISTSFGTVVWRGDYSPGKHREKSTGWLFIEAISGPPAIWDSYDPKTDKIR